jgi:hypothetical protein
MAKDIKTWIIVILVIAGALFLGGMYTQKQHPLFALLPAGEYSAPSDCSFITNENPYTARATTYDNTGTWIAIDVNSDGIKEKFGRRAGGGPSGSCTGGTGECTGFGTLQIMDYNSGGDDLYINGDNIYVATPSGYYTLFAKDYGVASNAITTCTTTPVCTPSWTCGAWGTCTSGTQTRTCTDSNSCGVSTGKPAESQSCTPGTCAVTFDQLIQYASQWASC